jgi:hypothetical protein
MAIQRIKVLDYQELGKKFITWSKDPDSRPKTLEEFVIQTAGIVDTLPGYIKALQFVQADKEVLLVRLPPAELVADTEASNKDPNAPYPLPTFYEERLKGGVDPGKQAFFERRVGDYTIAHCN